jgi:DNA-directed RNA polymerase specialized sigma24 family protein
MAANDPGSTRYTTLLNPAKAGDNATFSEMAKWYESWVLQLCDGNEEIATEVWLNIFKNLSEFQPREDNTRCFRNWLQKIVSCERVNYMRHRYRRSKEFLPAAGGSDALRLIQATEDYGKFKVESDIVENSTTKMEREALITWDILKSYHTKSKYVDAFIQHCIHGRPVIECITAEGIALKDDEHRKKVIGQYLSGFKRIKGWLKRDCKRAFDNLDSPMGDLSNE